MYEQSGKLTLSAESQSGLYDCQHSHPTRSENFHVVKQLQTALEECGSYTYVQRQMETIRAV